MNHFTNVIFTITVFICVSLGAESYSWGKDTAHVNVQKTINNSELGKSAKALLSKQLDNAKKSLNFSDKDAVKAAQDGLQKIDDKYTEYIINRINDVIVEYYKLNKYSTIFNVSEDANAPESVVIGKKQVLNKNNSSDITDTIIKLLNKKTDLLSYLIDKSPYLKEYTTPPVSAIKPTDNFAYFNGQIVLNQSVAGKKAKDILAKLISKYQTQIDQAQEKLKQLKATDTKKYEEQLEKFQKDTKYFQDTLQELDSKFSSYITDELNPIIKAQFTKKYTGLYSITEETPYLEGHHLFSGKHLGRINSINASDITSEVLAYSARRLEQVAAAITDKPPYIQQKPNHSTDVAYQQDAGNSNNDIKHVSRVSSESTEAHDDIDKNIPEGQKAGKYDIAVIIGNHNYSASGAPDVDYANRDAQMMREYLVRTLGFDKTNIIYVEDATVAKFYEIFGTKEDYKGKLFKWVKPGQSKVFVYYAGHGAPDVDTNEAYFLPVDANPQMLKISGYRLQTFYNNLSKIGAKRLMVVLDSCFSGASAKGSIFKGTSALVRQEKIAAIKPSNAIVLASSSGDQFSSWYPEKRHSLFTYYLLKGLSGDADSNKDGRLTVGELKSYLLEQVPYMARKLTGNEQVPQLSGKDDDVLAVYKR